MLAFVHIPKTAGTTLHKILTHQYPRVFIHHDSDGPADAALAARILAAAPQVIMGHFSVGIHERIPGIRYITCLRDPVARLVSHYHHAISDPSHYLHEAITKNGLDLAGYAASGLSGELSNGMTRMLAGVPDFHHSPVDERTLRQAKRHIEEFFDGVLLSEFFDAGVVMLAASMKWRTPYYLRRKVGKYGGIQRQPDERTRRVIEEHNPLDRELHQWASERFLQQASSYPDLTSEVERFQRANRFKGKIAFCLRELSGRLKRTAPPVPRA